MFSYHFVLHILLFQLYDNTKREPRHFDTLKRHKNTTGRRKSRKNVVAPGNFFKFSRVSCMNEINIPVLNRVTV